MVAHVRKIGEREHRAFEPEQSIDLPSRPDFSAYSNDKSNSEWCIWIAGAHNSLTGTKEGHEHCLTASRCRFLFVPAEVIEEISKLEYPASQVNIRGPFYAVAELGR